MKSAGLVLTVLVLVGAPLGVFLVARNTAPPVHLVSVAATERQMRAQLRRMGANDIQCQVEDHGRGVLCVRVRASGRRRPICMISASSSRHRSVATLTAPPGLE
jgi:hypothetical protein